MTVTAKGSFAELKVKVESISVISLTLILILFPFFPFSTCRRQKPRVQDLM